MVTGGGGLALLAGVDRSEPDHRNTELSLLLNSGDVIRESPFYLLAFWLVIGGGVHQVGAVSVSFLAAQCHGSANAGFGLSAFGNHGEGWRISVDAHEPGSG